MNGKQSAKIGQAVTRLLDYAAAESLELTTTPIEIEPAACGWQVTLCACKPGGFDYHVRLGVTDAGKILTSALVREWDPAADAMTDWRPREIASLTRR